MECKAGRCKTSTLPAIFIGTPSIEGLPTKAKEVPSSQKVRLVPLDTNQVFQSLGDNSMEKLDSAFVSINCTVYPLFHFSYIHVFYSPNNNTANLTLKVQSCFQS